MNKFAYVRKRTSSMLGLAWMIWTSTCFSPAQTILAQAPDSMDAQAAPAAPVPQPPVDLSGNCEIYTPDKVAGYKSLLLAFRASSSLGPAKGFLTCYDRLYAFTFSGTVREVEVLEAASDGSPKVIRLWGVSEDHVSAQFTCTVVAPDKGSKGKVALSLRGLMVEDVPLVSLFSGTISINGA